MSVRSCACSKGSSRLFVAAALVVLLGAGCARVRVASVPPPLPPSGAKILILPVDDLGKGGRAQEESDAFNQALAAELAPRGVKVLTGVVSDELLGADRVSSAWGVDRVSAVAAGNKIGATAVVIGVMAADEGTGFTRFWQRGGTSSAVVQWVNTASGRIEGMTSMTANGVSNRTAAQRLASSMMRRKKSAKGEAADGDLACIAVAALANRTKAPGVSLLISDLLGAELFGMRGVGVLDRREFTNIFAAAELPVPDWISPELAMDLGRVLGADAVVHGIVDRGNDHADPAQVRVTLYLTNAAGETVWFRAEDVRAGRDGVTSPGIARAVRNAVNEMRRLTDPNGPGQRGCFPPDLKNRIVAAAREPEDLADIGRREPLPPDDLVAAKLSDRQRGIRIKLRRARSFTLPGVVFGPNGELLPESHEVLDDLAAVLQLDDSLKVDLDSHVDNSGDPARDQVRALGRALRVRAYLLNKTVGNTQVKARSRGSSRPILPNITLRGRQKNRRIEVVLRR